MTAYMENLRASQEARQTGYPKDRIAFMSRALPFDMRDFKEYREGRMSFEALRRNIAVNNLLDKFWDDGMIPVKTMRTELKYTGWERPYGIQ